MYITNSTKHTLWTVTAVLSSLLLPILFIVVLMAGCSQTSPTPTSTQQTVQQPALVPTPGPPIQQPTQTTTPTTDLSEQEAIGVVQSFLREVNCGLPSSDKTPKWEASQENGGVWKVRYFHYQRTITMAPTMAATRAFASTPTIPPTPPPLRYSEYKQEWILSPSGIVTSQQGIC